MENSNTPENGFDKAPTEGVRRGMQTATLDEQHPHPKLPFSAKEKADHRNLQTNTWKYVRSLPLATHLTAPIIYAMFIPIALMDLSIAIYQACCFRAWGVTRISRSDYVVIDRQHLAYLNPIEKINCAYCGYANGVLAWSRAVAARTEQYWCPIKHDQRTEGALGSYGDYAEFGDAETWSKGVKSYRRSDKNSDNK